MDEIDELLQMDAAPPSAGFPTSISAVAIDHVEAPPAPPNEETKEKADATPELTRRVPLRFKLLVGTAVAGCVAILVLATMSSKASPKASLRPAEVAVAAASPPPASPPIASALVPDPLPAAAPRAPTPPPAALTAEPPPSIGTIRLAKKGQPLNVDGKVVKEGAVDVSCGHHSVAVGKEKPHRVDVACGHTLVVAASEPKSDAKKGKARPHDHAHGAVSSARPKH